LSGEGPLRFGSGRDKILVSKDYQKKRKVQKKKERKKDLVNIFIIPFEYCSSYLGVELVERFLKGAIF
jgi:hypothetical protein